VTQRLGQQQRVETSTTLRVDPRVVLSSQLLQLSQVELEQAIDTELNDNPALERLQEDSEPITDESILRTVAPHELRPSSEDFEFQRSLPNDDDTPDWVDLASSQTTLIEHLRAQVLPALPASLRPLGEYLVECVNDKGYLNVELEEIALATKSSLEETEAVLRVLQSCEPAGIGARNLRECLLLQLRDAETYEKKLARKIVRECMDEFAARRTTIISRRFRVLPTVIESAFDEILSLNPFPGENFVSGSFASVVKSVGVTPDLRLTRTDQGWTVDVLGPDPSSLRISRAYNRRLKELETLRNSPKDEKRHLGSQVQRATDFISCVEQRRITMRKIGEYLVLHQPGFISTGQYQFLQPLTRCKMATAIGIHESTVSRATMDKFVQLSTGETVPFEVFFKPALRVQKMIEEILATENPANPLSDETIAKMLAKKGVVVARRTVNKYRDRTKLLSSRKRRSA
jgi:RNA polymerase sigma-54 factor